MTREIQGEFFPGSDHNRCADGHVFEQCDRLPGLCGVHRSLNREITRLTDRGGSFFDFPEKGEIVRDCIAAEVPRDRVGIVRVPAGQDVFLRRGVNGFRDRFAGDNFLAVRRCAVSRHVKVHRIGTDQFGLTVPVQADGVIRVVAEKDSRVRFGEFAAVVCVCRPCEHTGAVFHRDADGTFRTGEGSGNLDDQTSWQIYV